jgi:hypothetical protein
MESFHRNGAMTAVETSFQHQIPCPSLWLFVAMLFFIKFLLA